MATGSSSVTHGPAECKGKQNTGRKQRPEDTVPTVRTDPTACLDFSHTG